MRRTTGSLLTLLLSPLIALGACTDAESNPSAETRTAPPAAAPRVPDEAEASNGAPVDVVTGLDAPWDVLPQLDGSLIVCERDSRRILMVRDGRATELTTLAEVVPGGEGGLLGLALDPERRRLFAYFTAADDNRIVAMDWDGNRLGRPSVIFDGIPKGGRHNGGRMVVGPDGYLYVGTGEAGQDDLAQDRSSLGGKILRLSLDGEPAPDNPYGDAIWSWGHRNVQGLAFDDAGRLWASEFGDRTWDELNLITKGANYGWPRVEGSGSVSGMTNPKAVWPTSDASPSGLVFADGALWMAGLRGERLWRIPVSGTEVGEPSARYVGTLGRLRTVRVAPDGDRLLVSTSNTDGRGTVRDGDDRIVSIPLG